MAVVFKERYHYESLSKLALEIQKVYDRFSVEAFLAAVMDETWEDLSFKQRIIQISTKLGQYLPKDYTTALSIIDKVLLNYAVCLDGFVSFFPSFVALYGLDQEHWALSMAALERYTPYATAEFAVRAFIVKDEKRMMAQMLSWTKSSNEHVRRLASEGCRPRLPWGEVLPNFEKDPSLILPILEQLKTDPSPYVRKSVANNLNDISKSHPDLVKKIAKDWYGKDKNTDWIVKHGCRTLLKKGDREMLALFGFTAPRCVKVTNFTVATSTISIGENMLFSFEIEATKATKIRIEYSIDYVKAKGRRNQKIFFLSTVVVKKEGKRSYTKSHSFADTSTRKHYPGVHSVTLIINGEAQGTIDFALQAVS